MMYAKQQIFQDISNFAHRIRMKSIYTSSYVEIGDSNSETNSKYNLTIYGRKFTTTIFGHYKNIPDDRTISNRYYQYDPKCLTIELRTLSR